MSEEIDTAEVTTGMDRRSVLKKAALVGAVAWTAPVIVSSPVLAGACTPACAPQNIGNLQVQVRDACANEIAALAGVTGNANKIAFVRILSTTATCPCGTATPVVDITGQPTAFSKGNDPGLTGSCDPFVDSPSNPSATQTFPNAQLNEFIVYKNGAMPNGWYTGNAPICVSIKCTDRVGGDAVYMNCKYLICFQYSPAGSCRTFGNYGFRLTPVGPCVASCNPGCA